MAAARVSHKRSYDDFITPYGSFGYSAHAGRNVESVAVEKMDAMDDFVPTNKRTKYAFHDDESAVVSAPSTQATLAAKAIQSMPKLSATNELLDPQTWLKALPRSRRRHHELIGTIGCIGRNDSVFSLDDVTNILTAALKAQEERLHVQYQAVVGEKIEEVAREYEAERDAEIRSRSNPSDMSYYS